MSVNNFNTTPLLTMLRNNDTSWEACKIIFADHPLGLRLCNYWVKMAFLTRPKVKFSNYGFVLDKLADRNVKKSGLLGAVQSCLIGSRIYGESILYSVQEYPEGDKRNAVNEPIIVSDVKDAIRLVFKWADPLVEQGSTDLDPLSTDFMETNQIYLNGVPYSSTRYKVAKNGIPLYLQYTNEAFRYTGRSAYHNAFILLLGYVELFLALRRISSQGGSMVIKSDKDKRREGYETPTTSVMNAIKTRFDRYNESGNADYIPLFSGEEIQFLFTNQHVSEMEIVLQMYLSQIATAAEIDKKYLLGDSYSSVMADGGKDFDLFKLNVNQYRFEMVEPLLEWGMQLLVPKMMTQNVFTQLRKSYKELASLSKIQIYNIISNDYTIEWDPFFTDKPQDIATADSLIIDNILKVVHMSATPSPETLAWAMKSLNEKLDLTKSNKLR